MKRFGETSGGGLSRIPPVGHSHGIGHIPQRFYKHPRHHGDYKMPDVNYHSAGTKGSSHCSCAALRRSAQPEPCPSTSGPTLCQASLSEPFSGEENPSFVTVTRATIVSGDCLSSPINPSSTVSTILNKTGTT